MEEDDDDDDDGYCFCCLALRCHAPYIIKFRNSQCTQEQISLHNVFIVAYIKAMLFVT